MNILDYIPKGKAHAVKGNKLAEILGVDERTVRELIMKERNKGAVILNVGGGSRGYFVPILPDEIDCVVKELDAVNGRIFPAETQKENLMQVLELFPI